MGDVIEQGLTPSTDVEASPAPGRTVFAQSVIEAIAGIAARQIPGVHKLGKGVVSGAAAALRGTSGTSRGVSAEVGTKEVAIDLEMVVEYGHNIHEVAAAARHIVAENVERMTGLIAKEVNIVVVDIHYVSEDSTRSRVE